MNEPVVSPPLPHAAPKGPKALPWALVLLLSLLSCCGVNVFYVVIPKLESARRDRAELDLKNLRSALKLYQWKMGRFPTTEEGLQSLVDVRALEQVPIDPWSRPYGYSNEGGMVELWSLGRDGVRGCESDDLTARAPVTP